MYPPKTIWMAMTARFHRSTVPSTKRFSADLLQKNSLSKRIARNWKYCSFPRSDWSLSYCFGYRHAVGSSRAVLDPSPSIVRKTEHQPPLERIKTKFPIWKNHNNCGIVRKLCSQIDKNCDLQLSCSGFSWKMKTICILEKSISFAKY